MTSTISHATGTIAPLAIDGYEASIEMRSRVHVVMGRRDPDITRRPAGLRTGTLSLVFASRSEAWAAVAALSVPQVLTLTDAEVPQIGMSFFIADAALVPRFDDRIGWTLAVPFQEVLS